MDKFLEEMFGAIIDGILNGGVPTKEGEKLSDSDLDEKEFKSLVSDEEKKAVEEVQTAVKNLIRVHQKGLISKLHVEDSANAKQLLHYVVFSEICKDLFGNAKMLSEIDTRGVKALEEVHSEEGKTYSELLKIKCLSEIFSR